MLEQFPEAGRQVPEHNREDLRELVRPPYRIVYRLMSDQLHIVTVFHASRKTPDL